MAAAEAQKSSAPSTLTIAAVSTISERWWQPSRSGRHTSGGGGGDGDGGGGGDGSGLHAHEAR